jgi:hypothetical protein
MALPTHHKPGDQDRRRYDNRPTEPLYVLLQGSLKAITTRTH